LDKLALKNYAVNAQKKLTEQVRQKAFQIGITAQSFTEFKQEMSHIILSDIPQEKALKLQRDKLIKEIEQKGYDQVIAEIAYTWFNRFIALRFMEVNDYLPKGGRVLPSIDPNSVEPDVIIHQCNELNEFLPFMFETISDYTELIFPNNLLKDGSVIRELVTAIPEEDWKEVEVISWLHQYYISEKKDKVFADLKNNKKITKENIPAATQLFTPKWIVQYMVENSLGRLWLESHPNQDLKGQWKYYIEEAAQEPEVQRELETLINPDLNPLDIKVLDPCCGSGHILVYAFELLYEIYTSYGYMEADVPKLILENNLYGLDIDDRAAQLASFAVMMKARSKSRGIFKENIKLNICAIQESNWMGDEVRKILVDREAMKLEQNRQQDLISYLVNTFRDAKEFGSILDVRELELEFLDQRLDKIKNSVARDSLEVAYRDIILEKLPGILLQVKIMGSKYHVVCTNPPYMGRKGMNPRLSDYIDKNFANSKSDLFAVFIEKCLEDCMKNGYISMVTQHSWMFLSSMEKLREKIFSNLLISSMNHLGPRAFEEIGGQVVQATAFVLRNCLVQNAIGTYVRLVDYNSAEAKENKFHDRANWFRADKRVFKKIPGSPIAYWASPRILAIFEHGIPLDHFAEVKRGMTTSDNNRFLRYWHEVAITTIFKQAHNELEALESRAKWFPYSKGGGYRKWYGYLDHVINWEDSGKEVIAYAKTINKSYTRTIVNMSYYYLPSVGFSYITSGPFSMRWIPEGCLYDSGGPGVFADEDKRLFILGCLNSKPARTIFKLLNPTINLQIADVVRLPLPNSIENIYKDPNYNRSVRELIRLAKNDWDSFETSWDFISHPFVRHKFNTLEESYNQWSAFSEENFNSLKTKEEEINNIFIQAYGLQDELTPEIEETEVTINKADQERDIKSYISYAVGCILGRYSLDEEGLVFAGGKFDPQRYKVFKAEDDGILPVLGDPYFEDDIVTRFVKFVEVTFGRNTMAANLDYIAESIGRKVNETSKDCIRRYFLKEFYKNHVQIYKKRPIYWLFTSGKEQGFNALVYMHRYDRNTVSRVRTDYLHPLQNKLEAECLRLKQVLVSEDSPPEKAKTTKRLKALTKQMDELKKYDEVIHNLADQQIEIDLDDGVVVNYAKLAKVLTKI